MPVESAPVDQAGEGPQRGPDGRFLTAVPVTSPDAKGPEDKELRLREDGHVPISALLDEREKRQAEKAQREALEQQIAEMRARAAPARDLAPAEQLEVALYSQNLRASRRFAERIWERHGGRDPRLGHRRCDEDPAFNQQMRLSDDPYEAAYQAYHREQILQTVRPDDLAAFKAWQAAQARPRPKPRSPPRERGPTLGVSDARPAEPRHRLRNWRRRRTPHARRAGAGLRERPQQIGTDTMAETILATASERQVWSNKYFAEYIRNTRFQPYMSNADINKGGIILTKFQGDEEALRTINIPFIGRLKSLGVTGARCWTAGRGADQLQHADHHRLAAQRGPVPKSTRSAPRSIC